MATRVYTKYVYLKDGNQFTSETKIKRHRIPLDERTVAEFNAYTETSGVFYQEDKDETLKFYQWVAEQKKVNPKRVKSHVIPEEYKYLLKEQEQEVRKEGQGLLQKQETTKTNVDANLPLNTDEIIKFNRRTAQLSEAGYILDETEENYIKNENVVPVNRVIDYPPATWGKILKQ